LKESKLEAHLKTTSLRRRKLSLAARDENVNDTLGRLAGLGGLPRITVLFPCEKLQVSHDRKESLVATVTRRRLVFKGVCKMLRSICFEDLSEIAQREVMDTSLSLGDIYHLCECRSVEIEWPRVTGLLFRCYYAGGSCRLGCVRISLLGRRKLTGR
jgi:hypothetical protein